MTDTTTLYPREPLESEKKRLWTIVLLVSTGLISVCAIIFELLIASLSSYLLGNSVYQFSITIGLYLSSMGIGSWLSQYFKENLIGRFAMIEIFVGILGGSSAVLLYYAFGDGTGHGGYTAMMVSLTVLIGTGVGFEIPLLIRIIKRFSDLRVSVANVLAVDYLGSLLGSVAFPIFLLVHLGIVRTSLVVGTINVIVAVAATFVFRRHIRGALPLVVIGVLCTIGLIVGAGRSTTINAFFERRLYRDPIEMTEQSPYQRMVVTRGRLSTYRQAPRPKAAGDEARPRRPFVEQDEEDFRLYLDGDLQFSSIDEYRYHEALVHPAMSAMAARRGDLDVLLLGAGDGLAAREVLRYDRVRSITLVDLDSAVTDLARQFEPLRRLNGGSLFDPRVTVVHRDGFTYLLQTKWLFDTIIVDLPDPDVPALSKLYSVAFYQLAKRHLADDGLIVTQSTSPYFTPRTFWCIHRTMEQAGLHPTPYVVNVPAFGIWGFNVAGRRQLDVSQLSLRVGGLRFLNQQVMRGLFALPLDLASVPVEPNVIDRPVIIQYYQLDERDD